jgi:hypothetical protein
MVLLIHDLDAIQDPELQRVINPLEGDTIVVNVKAGVDGIAVLLQLCKWHAIEADVLFILGIQRESGADLGVHLPVGKGTRYGKT